MIPAPVSVRWANLCMCFLFPWLYSRPQQGTGDRVLLQYLTAISQGLSDDRATSPKHEALLRITATVVGLRE